MLGALSAPVAITAAALALPYAGCLELSHFVANVAWAAASFAVQAGAAVLTARLLCAVTARPALLAFTRALRPQEVMFVALTLVGVRAGAVILGVCMLWQIGAIVWFFRGLGARWPRAVAATFMHYAFIALFVMAYAHALDLFPYPPAVP